MSYKTGIKISCANRAAALTQIYSYLVSMGWILAQNGDASSYRVYKTTDETNSRYQEFVKIDFSTADKIRFKAYKYWDSSVGYGANTNTVDLPTSESGFSLWIYGNKNLVFLYTLVSGTYSSLIGFGHVSSLQYDPILNRYWETNETKTQYVENPGDDVIIQVGTTAGFIAGRYYQMISPTDKRQEVKVTVVNSPTALTIEHLYYSFPANTFIGICPSIFGVLNADSLYGTCPLNASGDADVSNVYDLKPMGDPANCQGDRRGGGFRIFYPVLVYENENGYKNLLALITDYAQMVGENGLTPEDVIGINELDSGTADSGTSNSLTDTSKSWGNLSNKVVVLDSGTGDGQIRKISSNTATLLIITPNWTINPDATTTYKIYDEAWRYMGDGWVHQEGI